ncbi:MAG: zinc-binding dehydrogenase, partial [Alphaproteobacteria bacterium]|nr:zinc-binding dehydrogenase [Alphaproteobacteria bacterium]
NAVGLYDASRAFGAAAEFCALPAERAVPLPEGLDFAAGACLGVPACTAHRAVFADGPVDGQTLLVQGGAGAVGHYAVQFAALAGAKVIATVSGAAKAKHAKAAGAAATVDRKTEDVIKRVQDLTQGQGVDRIVEVDFGANIAADVALLKVNGTIASYSSTAVPEPVFPYYPLAMKGANLRIVQGFRLSPAMRAQAVADIARLSAAGKLIHAIDSRFPLAEIARAHERVESGQAIGNVLVEIG